MGYRNNCFVPSDWKLLNPYIEMEFQRDRMNVFAICEVDSTSMTRTDYLGWVETWKYVMNSLSRVIRVLKDNEQFYYANQYAKLVNTLLNAREYSKQKYKRIRLEQSLAESD